VHIGSDATCWTNERGYGRYTRELIRAMTETTSDNELVCFLDHTAGQQIDLHTPNVRIVSVPQSGYIDCALVFQPAQEYPRAVRRFTRKLHIEPASIDTSFTWFTSFFNSPASNVSSVESPSDFGQRGCDSAR
jgi:hypothetical protein